MSLETGRERFQRAVEILVEEKERIKDRLLVAYASQLSLIDAKTDLPADLTEQFLAIRNLLSDAGMAYGYGEHAAAKLRAMSDEQAADVARRIYILFLSLHGLKPAEGDPTIGK